MEGKVKDADSRSRGSNFTRVSLARIARRLNWKKLAFAIIGIVLFCIVYFAPPISDAIDPQGRRFALTQEGKAALALFLLAAFWWIYEVVPIGVTSIAIGVIQAAFLIRDPGAAFNDFMDPSVWFIVGSLVIGMTFTKTGLTRRMAYKMIVVAGERTSMICLCCFAMTAGLTLFMAHTAVAATVFPLLMAVSALYDDSGKPTRFGKGRFMGMAFVAGAGSIITLLGAARGAVAIGFYKQIVGREITFFGLTYYMLPLGVVMVALIWLLLMLLYRPEKKTIPGLRERSRQLYAKLGPITPVEIVTLLIVLSAVVLLGLRSFVPALGMIDKSAVILMTTVLFFLFRILTLEDLEKIPWNIFLLFGGAMSMGYCLWQTGAAQWLGIHCLVLFQETHGLFFLMIIALFVLVMTNFIMNVAVIAISMPVALVVAPYFGLAPDVIFFATLVAAGMPFLLVRGAAPNAIAYESKQFTMGEFFKTGIGASIILLIVLYLFVSIIWPAMGMPILSP